MLTSLALLATGLALATAGDINRQSIIFNENTPDVFYCPQEKPISIDRMLVKSKPMKKRASTRAGDCPRMLSLTAGMMWTRLNMPARIVFSGEEADNAPHEPAWSRERHH